MPGVLGRGDLQPGRLRAVDDHRRWQRRDGRWWRDDGRRQRHDGRWQRRDGRRWRRDRRWWWWCDGLVRGHVDLVQRALRRRPGRHRPLRRLWPGLRRGAGLQPGHLRAAPHGLHDDQRLRARLPVRPHYARVPAGLRAEPRLPDGRDVPVRHLRVPCVAARVRADLRADQLRRELWCFVSGVPRGAGQRDGDLRWHPVRLHVQRRLPPLRRSVRVELRARHLRLVVHGVSGVAHQRHRDL